MKVVIIEDETAAARNLKAVLKDVAPHITVIATYDSIQGSVEWFRKNEHPDVVFMDIHLSDGEAFHIFDKIEIKSPIIFTTTYNEYALQAFKVNCIDYLLKPIHPEEVLRALNKLKILSHSGIDNYIKQASILHPPKSYLRTLLIFYKDKILPINTEQIAYFFSNNEKTYVFTKKEEVFQTEKTLNSLTAQLDSQVFHRANRQYIIARHCISEINIWPGNRLHVVLTIPSKEIIISKERSSEFKRWLCQHV